jgi:hypothetical protein
MTDKYDNLRLCAYLFVADRFDENKKIFESFCPLIESVLAQMGNIGSISFLSLHQKLEDIYKARIPKATLKTLLRNLEKEGKIHIKENTIILEGALLDVKYLQERNDKENEILDLFLGFREFLQQKNIQISIDEVKQLVCNYIFTYCYDLANFISNNLRLYTCFLKLYKGAVQSTLLNFNPENIEFMQNYTTNITTVILDSNFIMRILDIQGELECDVAIETVKLLYSKNIQIMVLKQTIEEVSQSIKSFLFETAPYTQNTGNFYKNKNIRFSGIYASMQRGKTRTQLLELSNYDKLKICLHEKFYAQTIEDFDTPADITKEDIESLINRKNKEGYQQEQSIHDLTLIKYCNSHRIKRIDDYAKAKCWVLTNDLKLTSWNQENSKGIQQCITESQLANMFWLENPKGDNLGLSNTMVSLASGEFLDQNHFHRFINKINEYKEKIGDNPTQIQNFSLVFACDCITSEDIRRIDDDDYQIDDIIDKKADKIRQENKEKEISLKTNLEENKKLFNELKITKLDKEKFKLEKEIKEIELQTKTIEDKKGSLLKTLSNADSITKLKVPLARKLVCYIILFILIVLFLLFKVTDIYLSIIKSWSSWLNNLVTENKLAEILLPMVFTLVICFIFYILTFFIFGKLMSPKEMFNNLYISFLKKSIIRRNLPLDLINVDKDKLTEDTNKQLLEISQEHVDLKSNEQDLNMQLKIVIDKINEVIA